MSQAAAAWTNPSVLSLSGHGEDPVAAITAAARRMVLKAVDAGWDGPPYSPFELAKRMGVRLTPTSGSLSDARTVADDEAEAGVRIEYNPTRPAGRLRFNVAHELGHCLFPDVASKTRHRTGSGAIAGLQPTDEWQLEMLCNIAAAEFIMPAETLSDLGVTSLNIRAVMAAQRQLQVSTEALLRRIASLTMDPVVMFTAHARGRDPAAAEYYIDYIHESRGASMPLRRGQALPMTTEIRNCSSVGATVSVVEQWRESLPEARVEAVGIPAYPGQLIPRVAGLLLIAGSTDEKMAHITEVPGDALRVTGSSKQLILHMVNDVASGPSMNVFWVG